MSFLQELRKLARNAKQGSRRAGWDGLRLLRGEQDKEWRRLALIFWFAALGPSSNPMRWYEQDISLTDINHELFGYVGEDIHYDCMLEHLVEQGPFDSLARVLAEMVLAEARGDLVSWNSGRKLIDISRPPRFELWDVPAKREHPWEEFEDKSRPHESKKPVYYVKCASFPPPPPATWTYTSAPAPEPSAFARTDSITRPEIGEDEEPGLFNEMWEAYEPLVDSVFFSEVPGRENAEKVFNLGREYAVDDWAFAGWVGWAGPIRFHGDGYANFVHPEHEESFERDIPISLLDPDELASSILRLKDDGLVLETLVPREDGSSLKVIHVAGHRPSEDAPWGRDTHLGLSPVQSIEEVAEPGDEEVFRKLFGKSVENEPGRMFVPVMAPEKAPDGYRFTKLDRYLAAMEQGNILEGLERAGMDARFSYTEDGALETYNKLFFVSYATPVDKAWVHVPKISASGYELDYGRLGCFVTSLFVLTTILPFFDAASGTPGRLRKVGETIIGLLMRKEIGKATKLLEKLFDVLDSFDEAEEGTALRYAQRSAEAFRVEVFGETCTPMLVMRFALAGISTAYGKKAAKAAKQWYIRYIQIGFAIASDAEDSPWR